MTAQIAIWHAEHVNFARLLDLLEAQVAEFHDEGTPDYATMHDIVSYLREYPDRVHHAREDAAFGCMARRDPQLRPVINRLLQEHRVIATAGEELLSHLDQVVADAFVRRETLESAAATSFQSSACSIRAACGRMSRSSVFRWLR
jgi:hemerythrin-like domain-containing protein